MRKITLLLLWILFLLFSQSSIAQRNITLGSTAQLFESLTSYEVRSAPIDDDHFIVVWKGTSSSFSYIYGRIGQVDTTSKSVTYGSIFTLVTDANRYPSVTVLNSTQAVLFYEADLVNDQAFGAVVTFNTGTNTISSVGTPTAFSTGDIRASSSGGIVARSLGSSTFLLSWLDSESSNALTTCIGTVSGTSMSFGSSTVFSSINSGYQSIALLSTDKFVLTWEDDGTSLDPGVARVGTISGTTITAGPSTYTFHSDLSLSACRYTAATELNSSQFVVAFSDDANTDFGRAKLGTVSGTSISFGSMVTFENSQDTRDINIGYLQGDEFIISYNGGAGDHSKCVIGDANGGSITFGTLNTFLTSAQADESRVTVLDDNTFILAYIDESDINDNGEVLVGTLPALAPAPSVSLSVNQHVTCNGGSNGSLTATITPGTPNYTYTWSNGATTSNTSSTTNTNSSLSSGTYTVTITDNTGSTATASATVTQPSALSADAVVDSNVSCNSFLDGGATASASGGTGLYTYTWSNAATTASITGLGAATYTVTITDNNGCTDAASTTVTQPSALALSLTPTDEDCLGGVAQVDGSIDAVPSGGTTPYTYSWSNADTVQDAISLSTGTYTLTVTDKNGCTNSDFTALQLDCPTVKEVAAGCNSYNVSSVNGNGWFDIESAGSVIISINPNGNDLGTVTVDMDDMGATAPLSTGGFYYVPRYWNFSCSGGADCPGSGNFPEGNVSVKIYILEAELAAMNTASGDSHTRSTLTMVHYDGPNEDCSQANNDYASGTETVLGTATTSTAYNFGSQTGHCLEFSLPSFSESGLTGGTALPLEWMDVYVEEKENSLAVHWQTANEISTDGFEVERSSDGRNWKVLGMEQLPAQGNAENRYVYEDEFPLEGNSFYRVKQFDFDGRVTYSKVVSANYNRDKPFRIEKVFPNPSGKGEIEIAIFAPEREKIDLHIFSTTNSQLIHQQEVLLTKGVNSVDIDLSNYAKGIYNIQILYRDQIHIRRLVVL